MGYSPPGSSVHGSLQARILQWVAISFSRGSSQPKDQSCVSCISCISRLAPPGKPYQSWNIHKFPQISTSDAPTRVLFWIPNNITLLKTGEPGILQSTGRMQDFKEHHLVCFFFSLLFCRHCLAGRLLQLAASEIHRHLAGLCTHVLWPHGG